MELMFAPFQKYAESIRAGTLGRPVNWLAIAGLAGLLIVFVMSFLDGNIGSNRYGPDPKARA